MKITAQQAKDLEREGVSGDMELVDESGWDDEGKYQYNDYVFKLDGKFYMFNVSRSGSHFTDWNYDWEWQDEFDCYEVERVEIVKTEWRTK